MKETIGRHLKSTILVSAAIFLGSFFSYLLQWFMGRFLSVSDYGSFNSLLSIASIVAVPASVLSTSIVKRVSYLKGSNDTVKTNSYYWNMTGLSLLLTLLLVLIGLVFGQPLINFVNTTDTYMVLAFSIYMGLSFLWSLPYAYLQGLQLYAHFGFFITFSSLLRFVFPALIVYFSLGTSSVSGIFVGMAIALVLVYLVSFLLLKKSIFPVVRGNTKEEIIQTLKFILPVLLANVSLMALSNVDLILVKNFFSSEMAGYYAGTVTLGKILLFGASAVSVVMFPKVAALKASKGNVKRVFRLFLILQLAIVLVGLLLFLVFPKLIALAFFGTKFLNSVDFLPLFSIFVTLFVLLNYLVLFLLAIDYTKVYVYLIPLIVAQYILINLYHTTVYQVIYVNIAIVLIGCVMTFYSAVKSSKDLTGISTPALEQL